MKRKIIKQGHNTLTITIPSKWAKNLNLSSGDEVDLVERENGLVISAGRKAPERVAQLDITGLQIPSIWKHLMAVYREGYQEIVVTFAEGTTLENPYKYLTKHRENPKAQHELMEATDALHHFIERFIGLEIVQTGRRSVVIKQLGDPMPKEFPGALRRVYLLITQMWREIIEAMEAGEPKSFAHIHSTDINVDKFHDYCVRLLNQTGLYSPQKTHILQSQLFMLEMIGDELKNVAVHLHDEKYRAARYNDILPFIRNILRQWETFADFSFDYKDEKVGKLTGIDSELYLQVPRVYKKTGDMEKELLHHFRIISRYLNSLLELRIEEKYCE